MSPLLETERLTIRGIEERDAEPLVAMLNDPDWLRYVGDRGVYDVEQAIPYIRERMLGQPGKEHFGLYVVERSADAAWVGICSYFQRDYLDHPDIGFAFLPSGRGQGYAYEASSALLEHLMHQTAPTRILGITVRSNSSSIRLLEKLGMHFEKEMQEDETREILRVYAIDLPKS